MQHIYIYIIHMRFRQDATELKHAIELTKPMHIGASGETRSKPMHTGLENYA